jgi:hypothetical protein
MDAGDAIVEGLRKMASTGWRKMLRFAATALVTCLLLARDQGATPKNEQLWAAISIQPSVFWTGNVRKALRVHFTVVNDGPTLVNPKIGSSHFLINGMEPEDWKDVAKKEFDSLPPGLPLQFTYELGRYFTTPGVYTVEWSGEHFKAADIKIIVLPMEEWTGPKGNASVWAAVSVQPSVSWRNQSDQLLVCFSVFNDGPTPINPRSSHLLIKGEEPGDSWRTTLGGGLSISTIDEAKTSSMNELLPGRVEQFCNGLGEYFKKPGVYTVGWYGENFKAPDITIRVLPVDRFSFEGRPVK